MEVRMRFAVVLCTIGGLALAPASLCATGSAGIQNDFAGIELPGVSASVFRAPKEGVPVNALRLDERLAYHGTRVGPPDASFLGSPAAHAAPAAGASWSGKNTALAIFASAILPGMGELYCYTATRDGGTLARVPVLVALDGYLWYGYFHNHSKGKDIKQDYMDYADAHWELDRFLKNHPCCNQGVGDSCASWQDYNETCQGQINYFFYTPRELDTEEYYENIGKYNAFAFGWDDAGAWDYNNPDQFRTYQYWTPHRTVYWGLRKDSDKYLLRADEYLMGLVVDRIVSMLDAGWLAYRISKGHDPDKGWSLRFKTYDEAPTLIISRRF
jgi:hypothetical protein